MEGIIYLVTNTKSGKQYVGQTRRSLARRWHQHVADSKKPARASYLQRAIGKHGCDSFTKEVICRCPVEQLDENEAAAIKEHSTLFPKGYNLRDVASGISELSRQRKHDEDAALRAHIIAIRCKGILTGYRVDYGEHTCTFTHGEDTSANLRQAEMCLKSLQDGEVLSREYVVRQRRKPKQKNPDNPMLPGVQKRPPRQYGQPGYTVKIPGHPTRSFTSRKMTMEERLEAANLHSIAVREGVATDRPPKTAPVGINHLKTSTSEGYFVWYGNRQRKIFSKKTLSMDEKLAEAVAFQESLKQGDCTLTNDN